MAVTLGQQSAINGHAPVVLCQYSGPVFVFAEIEADLVQSRESGEPALRLRMIGSLAQLSVMDTQGQQPRTAS